MIRFAVLALFFLTGPGFAPAAPTPEEEATIAQFEAAGARVSRDREGHAIKLFSGGKPQHSVEDLQKIGTLKHLEELALNAPAAGDSDWGFLHDLPNLRRLTIWHGHEFSSLRQFCDLPIQALTVGGCMGIRDLNKDQPEKQRDSILTLTGLPSLTFLNLYHSPLAPEDAHLEHIVKNFPLLEELRLDFNAPRGFQTATTPEGLAKLQNLPLKILSLENINAFTPGHMNAIAGIETLESLLIDTRKAPFDTTQLVNAVRSFRPELDIQVAGEGASGPPRPGKKS